MTVRIGSPATAYEPRPSHDPPDSGKSQWHVETVATRPARSGVALVVRAQRRIVRPRIPRPSVRFLAAPAIVFSPRRSGGDDPDAVETSRRQPSHRGLQSPRSPRGRRPHQRASGRRSPSRGTGADLLDGGDGTDECLEGETLLFCEAPLRHVLGAVRPDRANEDVDGFLAGPGSCVSGTPAATHVHFPHRWHFG